VSAVRKQDDEIVDGEGVSVMPLQSGETVTIRTRIHEPLDARAAVGAADDQGVGRRLCAAADAGAQANDRFDHRIVLSARTARSFRSRSRVFTARHEIARRRTRRDHLIEDDHAPSSAADFPVVGKEQ
jgi:hypothetical protein